MSDEHGIDLYAPETQENWYPTYQKLRDENPVYQMPGSKIFVISRYQDVLHVLRHQEIFRTGTTAARSAQSAEIYKNTGWERITPLSVNPPEHRQYRDLVDHHFDASGSLRWLSFIESTVHELIDEFAGPGISAGGKTEFVQAFAIPLPVRAITRILGFPASDIPQLKEWSTAWVLPFSGPLTAEQDNWVATKVVEFQHYINHSIEEKESILAMMSSQISLLPCITANDCSLTTRSSPLLTISISEATKQRPLPSRQRCGSCCANLVYTTRSTTTALLLNNF